MSKIYDFLKEAGVFFIATEDGDQARVRPFELVFKYEDSITKIRRKQHDT